MRLDFSKRGDRQRLSGTLKANEQQLSTCEAKMKFAPFSVPLALALSVFLDSVHGQSADLGVDVSDPLAPVVNLGYAQYQGTFNTSANSTFFIGIRYAAPPTGK